MAIFALIFPHATQAYRVRFKQRWSRRLLDIFAIRLVLEGPPIAPGSLIVANHISWLDIFVINAACPAAFVSKAEIRSWPLFGWMAAKNETVFLRRGSRGHARIVNGEIGELLTRGRHVAVFPEGTTTDGSHVLGFHGALLQAAISSACAVQPLSLAYRAADGAYSRAPAYDGDISLGQSIAAIIAERRLVARVRVAPALSPATFPDRRSLAHSAREAIAERLAD